MIASDCEASSTRLRSLGAEARLVVDSNVALHQVHFGRNLGNSLHSIR